MKIFATVACLAIALACLSAPALAKGEILFEKAKGWDIERSAPGANAQHCMMSRAYRDPEDNNAENGVVLVLSGGQAFVTLVYENWTWEKGRKLRVPLMLDGKVVVAGSDWAGEGQALSAVLPEAVVPEMAQARKLVLKFDDGQADFDIDGFSEAYLSLRRCDAAATKATVPTPPSEGRMQAFFVAAMLEAAIKECDVPTTGRQRIAFDGKLAILRGEMGPFEASVRESVARRPEPRCPSADDAPKLLVSVRDFIEKTPEEFIASVQGRSREAGPPKPKP